MAPLPPRTPLAMLLLVLLSGAGSAATCGNFICESGETAQNCPSDCWKILSFGVNNSSGSISDFPMTSLRAGCTDTPANCMATATTNVNISTATKAFLAISLSTITAVSYATEYSTRSLTSTFLEEIGVDDFGNQYQALFSINGITPSVFLGQVIDGVKSGNANLKFGITLYEDDLDNPTFNYIDDSQMPPSLKARIDYVHLYIHYRKDGARYAAYVSTAQQRFPNAKIIAGAYPYDRIDYIACSPGGSACTPSEDMDYFQIAMQTQAQLLYAGTIFGVEFYPSYFGNEAAWPSWSNTAFCQASRLQTCINNTVAMRASALSILNTAKSPTGASTSPTIASLSPVATASAGSDFTLTVNGANFTGDATVSWNGSPRATTFVSPTQLQAVIFASDIATAGSANVTVVDHTPSTMTSGAAPFLTQHLHTMKIIPPAATIVSGGTQQFQVVGYDDGSVKDQAPLTLAWDFRAASPAARAFVSGRSPLRISQTSSNAVQVTTAGLVPGNYDLVLTLQDGGGATATATARAVVANPDLSQFRVFPNPWRASQHSGTSVTFDHLSVHSIIKIFTVSGRLARELPPADSVASWDLTNDSGEKVASGIYLYLITDDSGEKRTGKLGVIR